MTATTTAVASGTARRTRPLIAVIRTIHRWTSMTFVVIGTITILPVLPEGPVRDTVTLLAIAVLVLLLITGLWIAVRHYALKLRRRG